MHFSLPKSQDIFVRNTSSDVLRFQNKNEFHSLYSAYFSTSDPLHVVCLECFACLGIFMALCGYRFLKLAMFICGFILAFSAFYIFSPMFIKTKYCCSNHGNEEVHIGISALIGIILGLIVSRLYRIGVFFIGKSLGLLLALVLLQTPLGNYFTSNATVGTLFVIMAMIFASLASKFEKSLVIIATSTIGSYVALTGVDIFLKSSFSFAVFGFIIYFKEILQAGIHSRWHIERASLPHLQLTVTWFDKSSLSMLSAWVGLSVISFLIQYKITAKDIENGGYVCPFDFKSCICGGCCKKKDESNEKQQQETVYLFTNGDGYTLHERKTKTR